MKLTEMYPSRYLRGVDMTAPVTVVIARVVTERMYTPGEGETDHYVLYCERATRGVVLTKPLAQSIAQTLGSDDTDDWTGKRVVLYPQPMSVAGQRRVAIRARAAAHGAPTEGE